MPDHPIRLRLAWDGHFREGGIEVVRRVDLPTDWPDVPASTFRLERKFGCPPVDRSSQSVRLEILGVPGLVAASLNGRGLLGPAPGAVDWSIALLDPLLPRNLLVLEVDFRGLAEVPVSWGTVSMVISDRQGAPG